MSIADQLKAEFDRLNNEIEQLRAQLAEAVQEEAIARGAEADRMNAAARMAAALKDLYNECGEVNEVAHAYLSVAEDVDHYQYLGETEEEARQRLRRILPDEEWVLAFVDGAAWSYMGTQDDPEKEARRRLAERRG